MAYGTYSYPRSHYRPFSKRTKKALACTPFGWYALGCDALASHNRKSISESGKVMLGLAATGHLDTSLGWRPPKPTNHTTNPKSMV